MDALYLVGIAVLAVFGFVFAIVLFNLLFRDLVAGAHR